LIALSEEDRRRLWVSFGVTTNPTAEWISRQIFCLDSAKVNIVARSSKATWFRLIGVPIGNATPEYPNGDTVQVVEPWSPPSAWADTSPDVLNAILSEIDRGLVDQDGQPTGRRYSNAPAATDRQVWPVVQKHCPDKPEAQCRQIMHTWLDTGLLYAKEYDDPVQRRKRNGLYVNGGRRNGCVIGKFH
jgi:hypothetical protein